MRTAIERRDGVLVLLTRLGLRAGEALSLTMDGPGRRHRWATSMGDIDGRHRWATSMGDIDGRQGELVVHGKGAKRDCLPFPKAARVHSRDLIEGSGDAGASDAISKASSARERWRASTLVTPQGPSRWVCAVIARRSPRSPGLWPDSAERRAEEAFEARSVELGVAAQLGEHGLHLALTEAEVAQGGEDLGVRVDEARRSRAAVDGAVCVAEDKSSVVFALDAELPSMDGSVMGSA